MPLTNEESQRLMADGVDALQQGRTADARERFETLTAQGFKDAELAWLLLADACRAEKDLAGEEAALNRLIEVAPRSLLGHIRKGDCRARAGDEDLACYLYATALRIAEWQKLSEDMRTEVSRAEKALLELQERRHAARESRLIERGLPPHTWSPRLGLSLEHAAGRRKLFVPQPTSFTYVELPQIQFYDPGRFPWAEELESMAGAIRQELDALLESRTDEFRPYIQTDVSSVPLQGNKPLLNSTDWSVLGLCENGWLSPEIIDRCPRTWDAVLKTPVPRVAGWGPTIVFSMLKAGAHIAPHTGMFNARLICHLPLIVPPGCHFRVGNDVREWKEGKLLIFDDTIEHEAWNESGEDRVVLIFDIWRPELTEREKQELTALFSD